MKPLISNWLSRVGLAKPDSTAGGARVAFVELEEPVFTNRFLLRFLNHPTPDRSGIEATLKRKNVHIYGVSDHDDLAILIPKDEKAVDLCRSYLNQIAAEIKCPVRELGEVAAVLLALQ